MPAGGYHGTLAPSSSLLVRSWPLLPAFPVFLGILPAVRSVRANTGKHKPWKSLDRKFAIHSRGTLLLPLQLGDLIDLLLTSEVFAEKVDLSIICCAQRCSRIALKTDV